MAAMAAPKFSPVPPTVHVRSYSSPDHVPDPWMPDRPADLEGRQPVGRRLGYQGPDQGYALVLAERLRPDVRVQEGESIDDALVGATAIGSRRASLFGRAPVIHDVRIGLTIWGFLDEDPPAELVAERRRRFVGIGHVAHHYAQIRDLVDMVPESVLRSSPEQVAAAYPATWRTQTGVDRDGG
jgi:hypothetical protein